MQSYSHAERRSAWKITFLSLLLGLLLLIIRDFIGGPLTDERPVGINESVRGILTYAAMLCGLSALAAGPLTSLENCEVRSSGGPVIYNPISGLLGGLVGIALILCIVAFVLYCYLLARNVYLFFIQP